jgi:hypothetical protein
MTGIETILSLVCMSQTICDVANNTQISATLPDNTSLYNSDGANQRASDLVKGVFVEE